MYTTNNCLNFEYHLNMFIVNYLITLQSLYQITMMYAIIDLKRSHGTYPDMLPLTYLNMSNKIDAMIG